MKNSSVEMVSPAESVGEELARWVGRREAFAMTAGRCSADEVECLHRVRNHKLYRKTGLTWDEFCERRLGVNRRNIDRTLRIWDEFGRPYFEVAQIAHLTPDEYRAISPRIGPDGVHVNDEVVTLVPENREKVSAAVAELLSRERPPKSSDAPGTDVVLKRCEAAADLLCRVEGFLDARQKLSLAASLCRMRKAALGLGVPIISM